MPDDRTIVVERFRDELGDWRVVGALAVRRAGARAVGARRRRPAARAVRRRRAGHARRRRHRAAAARPRVRRRPVRRRGRAIADLVAARARRGRRPGHRARSAARRCSRRGSASAPRARCCCPGAARTGASRCGSSGSGPPSCSRSPASTPSFPIVLETVRECLQDVFDVPGLVALMRDRGRAPVRRRRGRDADAVAVRPQPAVRLRRRSSSTRATRRWPSGAPPPSRSTRPCWPSCSAGARAPRCATCSTPRPWPAPRPSSAARAGAGDAPGRRGGRRPGPACSAPLPHQADRGRCVEGTDAKERRDLAGRARGRPPADPGPGRRRGALGGDRGRRPAARRARRRRCRSACPRCSSSRCPTRSATWSRATPAPTARSRPTTSPRWFGLGVAVVTDALRRLVAAGRLVEGELRPLESGGGVHGGDFCDAEVLRTLRRRSLAALRAEVEPVPAVDLARFLPRWQGVGGRAARAPRACCARSSSWPAPSSRPAPSRRWCCPARVGDYSPALLDELTARRRGALVAVTARCPATTAGSRCTWRTRRHLTLLDPSAELELNAAAPRRARRAGRRRRVLLPHARRRRRQHRRPGRSTADPVGPRLDRPRHQRHARAAAGPARRRPDGPPAATVGAAVHAATPAGPRRWARVRTARCRGRPAMPSRTGPPTAAGRWSLLPADRARPDGAGPRRGRGAARPLRRGDPRRRSPPRAWSAASPPSTGCSPRPRRPAGCAAATSSRASARRSSRRGRGRPAAGPEPAAARRQGGRHRAAAAVPPRTPRTPGEAPDRPGQGGGAGRHRPGQRLRRRAPLARARRARPPVTGPAARPARWSCSSTARWCSTSSAAAGRCCPGPTTRAPLQAAADALALAVRDGALGKLTVEKADGGSVLGSDHPLAAALAEAGFHATPRGLRLRR